jgi:hypothetical protein
MVYKKGTLSWIEFWVLTAGKNIKRKFFRNLTNFVRNE